MKTNRRIKHRAWCRHIAKMQNLGLLLLIKKHDRRVSLIGDTHPVFHGSVVKAIASGMRTYPKILAVLKDKLGQRWR